MLCSLCAFIAPCELVNLQCTTYTYAYAYVLEYLHILNSFFEPLSSFSRTYSCIRIKLTIYLLFILSMPTKTQMDIGMRTVVLLMVEVHY